MIVCNWSLIHMIRLFNSLTMRFQCGFDISMGFLQAIFNGVFLLAFFVSENVQVNHDVHGGPSDHQMHQYEQQPSMINLSSGDDVFR